MVIRINGRRTRKALAESLPSTPDEEYEELAHVHSGVQAKIRDLEGFIDEAPQIRQRRKLETQVTLPPPEDDTVLAQSVAALDPGAEDAGEEDPQERYGRRHLEAMRRARRTNFYVFLISAAAVSAFLYWVSLVVQ